MISLPILLQLKLLPPANEFCKGYVFTPVCQSFCSQGGGGVPGQVHPAKDQVNPPGPGTPPGPSTPPRPGIPLGSSTCREIRATSGRYASYWNPFLFIFLFIHQASRSHNGLQSQLIRLMLILQLNHSLTSI